MEQKYKKRRKVLKIVGALVGVVFLVGNCGIVGLVFVGGDQPEASAASVPAYRAEMEAFLSKVADSMERWAEITGRAGDDPTLISTEEWRAELGDVAREMQTLCSNDLVHLPNPPAGFRPPHNKVVQAMRHFEAAASLTLLWLNTNDSNLLLEATMEVGLGSMATAEAAALVPD